MLVRRYHKTKSISDKPHLPVIQDMPNPRPKHPLNEGMSAFLDVIHISLTFFLIQIQDLLFNELVIV